MPTPSNLAETAQLLKARLHETHGVEELAFTNALIRHLELMHERPMQVEPWLWQSAMELAEAAHHLVEHRASSQPA
ncbi:hypothetical protein [Nonomuraea sp. NPDC049400]|uniref:hypothetical protein n=1 Tax=Nonomuraea sp. NPDC049400 TaxID=3364352 RepID=UPI00378C1D90